MKISGKLALVALLLTLLASSLAARPDAGVDASRDASLERRADDKHNTPLTYVVADTCCPGCSYNCGCCCGRRAPGSGTGGKVTTVTVKKTRTTTKVINNRRSKTVTITTSVFPTVRAKRALRGRAIVGGRVGPGSVVFEPYALEFPELKAPAADEAAPALVKRNEVTYHVSESENPVDEPEVSSADENLGANHLGARQLFARHLCPACPAGAKVAKGKNNWSNVQYCCPKVGARKTVTKIFKKTKVIRKTTTFVKTSTSVVKMNLIKGRIYVDMNGDGVYDAGIDKPYANQVINIVPTTTAAAGGATTVPAGGGQTTIPAGGAQTTIPAGGAQTTAVATARRLAERGSDCPGTVSTTTTNSDGAFEASFGPVPAPPNPQVETTVVTIVSPGNCPDILLTIPVNPDGSVDSPGEFPVDFTTSKSGTTTQTTNTKTRTMTASRTATDTKTKTPTTTYTKSESRTSTSETATETQTTTTSETRTTSETQTCTQPTATGFPIVNLGTDGWNYAYGVGTDPSGNVYWTGTYYGTRDVTLNNGSTVSLINSPNENCFVQKLTPDGTLEWIFAADISLKTAGNSCRPLDLVVVPDGSAVWITGYNNYNVLKLGSYTFNRAGSRDLLLVKLNAATGAVEYAAQSLSGDPTGYSIKADTQGNVYVTGDWSGANLDLGNSLTATLSAGIGGDAFAAKYLANGGGAAWLYTFASDTNSDLAWGRSAVWNGKVVVMGAVNGNNVTFPGDPNSVVYNTPATTNRGLAAEAAFVLELDASTGAFSKVLVWPCCSSNWGRSTMFGGGLVYKGFLYVLGWATGSMNLYGKGGSNITLPMPYGGGGFDDSNYDMFFVKLNATDWTLIDAKAYGSNRREKLKSIFVVNETTNELGTTGFTEDLATWTGVPQNWTDSNPPYWQTHSNHAANVVFKFSADTLNLTGNAVFGKAINENFESGASHGGYIYTTGYQEQYWFIDCKFTLNNSGTSASAGEGRADDATVVKWNEDLTLAWPWPAGTFEVIQPQIIA